AFLDVSVTDVLRLSPKKKEEIRKLVDEAVSSRKMPRFGNPGDMRRHFEKASAETMERILEQLTETQRKQWSEMVGDPVAIPFRMQLPEGFFLPPGPGPS